MTIHEAAIHNERIYYYDKLKRRFDDVNNVNNKNKEQTMTLSKTVSDGRERPCLAKHCASEAEINAGIAKQCYACDATTCRFAGCDILVVCDDFKAREGASNGK